MAPLYESAVVGIIFVSVRRFMQVYVPFPICSPSCVHISEKFSRFFTNIGGGLGAFGEAMVSEFSCRFSRILKGFFVAKGDSLVSAVVSICGVVGEEPRQCRLSERAVGA